MASTELKAKSTIRTQFFELLFGADEGFLCIATTHKDVPKSTFSQKFFEWPKDIFKVENFILSVEESYNVYFCVNLLSKMERKKANCLPTGILWADLDTASPDHYSKVPPPVVVSTSPGRFQAYWRLSTKLDPYQAEAYCKRLAYHGAGMGADISGWDLTQLMRVPLTKNFKYPKAPEIMLQHALQTTSPPLLFESLEKSLEEQPSKPIPSGLIPTAESIIYKHTLALNRTPFSSVYTQQPQDDEDWSSVLWRLLHLCFEAGMGAEEVFIIAQSAPCNKYARDGRPTSDLWRDILKAEEAQNKLNLITANFKPLTMPVLVTEKASETFIDTYREWAIEATDAIEQFHDLSCAIMLSAIVANSVRLNTSYGPMVPNLWGMILGDSTLSRKTTAMRMCVDFITAMDSDMIIATDGSAEGLLSGLATRPNRTSIFYKDEVSGFFDSINRKDYLAGMPETLTALYDVPSVFTRRLRKETITIESPAFVFLAGGVRERVYNALSEEMVLSGFLPRFLVVSGETDLTRLRPTGPATEVGTFKRANIAAKLADMYENYSSEITVRIAGEAMRMPGRIMAKLTPEAWAEYERIETSMVNYASASSVADLALPTFERLSRSLLKLAVILGASRQVPKDQEITITEVDVHNAAWYIQDWGRYSIDLVANAGKRLSEKLLEKICKVITEHPGIRRSTLTQHYHLTKREADEILATLEDRMLVRAEKRGNGTSYWIVA